MNLDRLDFSTDALPFIVATAGEFAALYFWLHFLDAGQFVLANGLLWGGFAVERIAVYLWIRYIYWVREGRVADQSLAVTIAGLFVITLSEVLIWIFGSLLPTERYSDWLPSRRLRRWPLPESSSWCL